MDEKYNLTYWIYLYFDILCYSNFVDSYNEFVNQHNMRKLRYQALTMIVKPIIVRDIAIPVWEFYKNFKSFAPEGYAEMIANEENERFIQFIKSVRNNMKYLPKKKKADITRIDNILEETSELVREESYDGKQTLDYFSGRYFGKHRLYGSTLITNSHIFSEVISKFSNEEINKFENSIPENLKAIKSALEQSLPLLKGITLPIPNNNNKNRFFAIHLNRNIDDMAAASGFEKEIIYLLLIAIQEINTVDICMDCVFDEEQIKDNTILLFFFTKWIAIKLDEIIDMFDAIVEHGNKYNLNADLFSKKLTAEVGNFEDLRETVKDLRNSLHYENAGKLMPVMENDINIDINAIFNTLCPGYSTREDYYYLYNKIRRRLEIVRVFCENNIGVKIFVKKHR